MNCSAGKNVKYCGLPNHLIKSGLTIVLNLSIRLLLSRHNIVVAAFEPRLQGDPFAIIRPEDLFVAK